MLSRCSCFELQRERAMGEVGMDRDDCPDSSLNEGGARLSLEGRLRANLDRGGGTSVLGPAWPAASCKVMGGAEGCDAGECGRAEGKQG